MSSGPRSQRQTRAAHGLHSPGLPLLLTAALLIVAAAALLPLIQSSGATTTNGHIQQLQREQTDWQARVQEAEAQLAYLSSLNRVQQEATQRLKMKAPDNVTYISVPGPTPQPETLPNRLLPSPTPPHPAGESLWSKLFGWLPLP
ncbi:MAG TPA: hypothetical protein VFB90_09560 [Dehalococcoidia bacterium]|nr:hypothetical protein [Dehalococcoidia bacterium]